MEGSKPIKTIASNTRNKGRAPEVEGGQHQYDEGTRDDSIEVDYSLVRTNRRISRQASMNMPTPGHDVAIGAV